ncbi:IFRD domain protein [Talaromyces stipitatus ATCC 10500]|uniref:IFRD domain protein n=1 Tax=Talaromyces stipitatus (strain ATCC 10500 / CBS 375.48 / QM 6759 / NRRL 1006) TaxID=441959 RepID=B8MNH6_TALSN|nr:IFRD domain protein [Talaromyces stipitatus ATCC 10500]EED14065.1 IFRD domain protein [Talaromyces stipitatus ATCC 10500]
MHDLRRQALLESRKTVSRKAASREASRSNSRVVSAQTSRQNSRQSSRAASRYPSDEEDEGNLSDETGTWSTSSLDDLAENPESDNADWPEELADCIQDILDRKRSSVQGREEALSSFCRLSKFHYVEEEIRNHIQDLLAAFSRSIKYESSVRESVLALKALEFLAVTAYDDTIYDAVESLLTRTIRDSTSGLIKVAAINCLGTCAYFGGTSEEAKMDQMEMLLDIVASDGQSIDASDDAAVVTVALQQWGFLATDIEDLEGESEEVVEIMIEQLASADSNVQIAAGENIALLYEKSYTPQEEEDESDEDEDNEDEEDEEDIPGSSGPKLIKRYTPYHDTYQLERILASLATVSGKRISKKDKKSLHTNFASILTTVENPRLGPMYSKAINQNTNRQYGSKRQVKVGSEGVMNIDRWWKWLRLASLRRVLQGGFMEHYFQGNRAVLDALPVMLRDARRTNADRGGHKKAARMRNSTKRMILEEDSL